MKERRLITSLNFFLILFLLLKHSLVGSVFAQGDSSQVFNMRVLVIVLNPEENGRGLVETYLSHYLQGKSVDEFIDFHTREYINAFKRFSDNTINYQVAGKVYIREFPPYTNGFEYDFNSYYQECILNPAGFCETQKRRFDNDKWIKENRICELANENQVDEIWLFTLHGLTQYEVIMIGPGDAFWTNGPGYNTPACRKHYVILGINYMNANLLLHIYGHKIEGTMSYLTRNWRSDDYQKYWENFAAVSRYSGVPFDRPYCGNAHYPPNADRGYDYSNYNHKNSTCPDWKNFPDFTGETVNINCQAWACDDPPWQEYWFSSLPRKSGRVNMIDRKRKKIYFKKNWWYYLLYPDNVIKYRENIPFSPEGLTATCLDSEGKVTLSWQPVPGITKYALRVNDKTDGWDDSCSSPAGDFCENNLANNSYTFSFTPGHQYTWWLHAINNFGWSVPTYGSEIFCSGPMSTPTLSPTPTATPTNTPTAIPTLTPTLTPIPTATPTSTATPTPSSTPCPNGQLGNLNCDSQGVINETDLRVLLKRWDPQEAMSMPNLDQRRADLNGDGQVDESDLSVLLSHWKI